MALGGCTLWLDASRKVSLYTTDVGSTQVQNSGDPIGRWEDLSGQGNHMYQGTAASRPTYTTSGVSGNRPSAAFDGAGDVMSTTNDITMPSGTVFVAWKQTILTTYRGAVKLAPTVTDIGTGGRVLYGGIPGAATHYLAAPEATASVYQFDNTVDVAGDSAVHSWGWGTTSSTLFFRKNGTAGAKSTIGAGYAQPSATKMHLGRGYQNGQCPCAIGEVIAFSRLLAAAEIAAVESYLRSKQGTP